MDYELFSRSKRIAELWGESQVGEHDAAYYQAALGQFYDYIHLLEAELFERRPSEPLPAAAEQSEAERQLLHQVMNFKPEESSEIIDDEEDPWFGFEK